MPLLHLGISMQTRLPPDCHITASSLPPAAAHSCLPPSCLAHFMPSRRARCFLMLCGDGGREPPRDCRTRPDGLPSASAYDCARLIAAQDKVLIFSCEYMNITIFSIRAFRLPYRAAYRFKAPVRRLMTPGATSARYRLGRSAEFERDREDRLPRYHSTGQPGPPLLILRLQYFHDFAKHFAAAFNDNSASISRQPPQNNNTALGAFRGFDYFQYLIWSLHGENSATAVPRKGLRECRRF